MLLGQISLNSPFYFRGLQHTKDSGYAPVYPSGSKCNAKKSYCCKNVGHKTIIKNHAVMVNEFHLLFQNLLLI